MYRVIWFIVSGRGYDALMLWYNVSGRGYDALMPWYNQATLHYCFVFIACTGIYFVIQFYVITFNVPQL